MCHRKKNGLLVAEQMRMGHKAEGQQAGTQPRPKTLALWCVAELRMRLELVLPSWAISDPQLANISDVGNK